MFPDLLGLFLNNWWISLPVGLIFGTLVGIFLHRAGKMGDEVCYLNPDNMTGVDIPVDKEQAKSVDTDEYLNMPPKHFLKLFGGYTIRKGRRFLKRFFACEALVFTVGITNPLGTAKVIDWIKHKLGDTYEEAITEAGRKILEESNADVTFQMKRIIPKDKEGKTLEPDTTEDDFLRDSWSVIPKILSQGMEGIGGRQLIEKFAWAGTGGLIVAILFIMKVFRI